MQIKDGYNYYYEAEIDGITFKAVSVGRQNLGRCYNRYDWKITANKPFSQEQATQFVRQERFCSGQGWDWARSDGPHGTSLTPMIAQDFVDSSD
jgi:hypothetical protein